jgi:hypothetical protein
MFNYHYGSRQEVEEKEVQILLSMKRMLPRWLNGLPDSVFIAIYELLNELGTSALSEKKKIVLVETGVGVSTLAAVYCALKYDGIVYSWDPNGEKGSQIGSFLNETVCPVFSRFLGDHWKHIAWESTSPDIGLAVLSELTDHVDYFLHDSDHVWQTIEQELDMISPLLTDGSIVAVDDAQYNYKYKNEFTINILRKKLGLNKLTFNGNNCQPIYKLVESHLFEQWSTVQNVAENYRKNYRNDPTINYYYPTEGPKLTLPLHDDQKHRFEAWKVSNRLLCV